MQLNGNLTLPAVSLGTVANPLTSMSEHWGIFPYSINTILRRQLRRVKKHISLGISSDPIQNSPN